MSPSTLLGFDYPREQSRAERAERSEQKDQRKESRKDVFLTRGGLFSIRRMCGWQSKQILREDEGNKILLNAEIWIEPQVGTPGPGWEGRRGRKEEGQEGLVMILILSCGFISINFNKSKELRINVPSVRSAPPSRLIQRIRSKNREFEISITHYITLNSLLSPDCV